MKRKMLNHKGEEVIYIEYVDNLPHAVLTAPIGGHGLSWFDFEIVNGWKTNIWFYESGGGGQRNEIQAPHFIKGTNAKYWIADGCKFKGKTKAKNCIRIDHPLQLRGILRRSINPFNVATESSSGFIYCSVCDTQTADGDGCREHQEWSEDEAGFVYIHDKSIVE